MFRSTCRFKCDGCKVIESDDIEVESDLMQAATPLGWLRVETLRRSRDLDMRSVHHYGPSCSRLIDSYLAGRREDA